MSSKDEKKNALDQDPIVRASAATGIFIGALIGSATGTLIKGSIDSTVGVGIHIVNQVHSCAKLASEISGNVAEITRNHKVASNKPDEQVNTAWMWKYVTSYFYSGTKDN